MIRATVPAILASEGEMQNSDVTILYSNDLIGETISVGFEINEKPYVASLNAKHIEEIIKKGRKK